VLSEVSAAIPDKPGHTFKQLAVTWKATGTSDLANFWASAVEQLRIPAIVTTNSDGSRPFVPIDRDQCKGAVRCIF